MSYLIPDFLELFGIKSRKIINDRFQILTLNFKDIFYYKLCQVKKRQLSLLLHPGLSGLLGTYLRMRVSVLTTPQLLYKP